MPDERRKELVYQLLNGFMEVAERPGELSREQMQVHFIVERIYQHRINLCKRTGLSFEDKDLEAVITAYEQLNRICANWMYDQGWHDAKEALERETAPGAQSGGLTLLEKPRPPEP